MDHVSLSDIIFVIMSTVFLLIRNQSTKFMREDVKTTVTNKGNETQIKVAEVHDCVEEKVDELTKKFEEAMQLTVSERMSHSAAIDELRALNNVLTFNLKRVVTQVGLEWKDDVTTVKEPNPLKE